MFEGRGALGGLERVGLSPLRFVPFLAVLEIVLRGSVNVVFVVFALGMSIYWVVRNASGADALILTVLAMSALIAASAHVPFEIPQSTPWAATTVLLLLCFHRSLEKARALEGRCLNQNLNEPKFCRPWKSAARIGILVFAIPAIGSVALYKMWSPLARGHNEDVLGRLSVLWDWAPHFYFFNWHMENGTFIANSGDVWQGREYPTVPHLLMSTFVRYFRGTTDNSADLLPTFVYAVLAFICVFFFVHGVAVSRLDLNTVWASILSTCLIIFPILIFVVGPFSQTISHGFVNFPALATWTSISSSLYVKRLPTIGFEAFAWLCLSALVAGTYFPMLVWIAPGLIRTLFQFCGARQLGRLQRLARVSAAASSLAVGLFPVFWALRLGVRHLDVPGGAVGLVPELRLFGFSVLLAGVLVALRWDHALWLALTILFSIGISLRSLFSIGDESYYSVKIELLCIYFGLISLGMGAVRLRISRSLALRCGLAVVFPTMFLMGFAGSPSAGSTGQFFLPGESVVLRRASLLSSPSGRSQISREIIEMSTLASDVPSDLQECLIPLPTGNGVVLEDGERTDLRLEGIWFHALRGGGIRESTWSRIYKMHELDLTTKTSASASFQSLFSGTSACAVGSRHVVAPLKQDFVVLVTDENNVLPKI